MFNKERLKQVEWRDRPKKAIYMWAVVAVTIILHIFYNRDIFPEINQKLVVVGLSFAFGAFLCSFSRHDKEYIALAFMMVLSSGIMLFGTFIHNWMFYGGFGLRCTEYKSSKCQPVCVEDRPHCECQAIVLDQLINKPGDWFIS